MQKTIMQKLLLSLIAALTVLGLAACGSVVTDVAPTHVASLARADGVTGSATGSARGRLVNVDFILEGDYRELSSTVASVQVERPDGSVVYSIQASGGTTGTFGRTQALAADDITALNNGDLTVVVYSTNYPVGTSGEVRGPLAPR